MFEKLSKKSRRLMDCEAAECETLLDTLSLTSLFRCYSSSNSWGLEQSEEEIFFDFRGPFDDSSPRIVYLLGQEDEKRFKDISIVRSLMFLRPGKRAK